MRYDSDSMRDLAILFLHLVTTVTRLFGPGGARSIVAESLLVKHQLLIVNRSRERAPNLRSSDRIIVGLCSMLIRSERILRSAIVLRPSTILSFHRALVKRKYRLLFTPKTRGKPGPKGPPSELIKAIVAMKQRNRNFAQQISLVFGLDIDKDVVRRVLARYYRPTSDGNNPSWLTLLGHIEDSLWSVDLFRCESATLRTYWALLVIDVYTHRIVGLAVHARIVDGVALCRMFNSAVRGQTAPKYLSSDHDPLYLFHR